MYYYIIDYIDSNLMNGDQEDSSFSYDEEDFTRLYQKQLLKAKRKQQKQTKKSPEPRSNSERSRSRDRGKKRQMGENREVRTPLAIKWNILEPCPPLAFEQHLPPKIRELPIINKKNDIMEAIIKNQFVLVTGDTGCGKSTQVPRIIWEYLKGTGDNKSKIMIVQPRRLAVTNLTGIMKRQIPEQNLVGYQIGMNSCISPTNRIVFVTNGIFLQRLVHSTDFF